MNSINSDRLAKIKHLLAKKKEEEAKKLDAKPQLKKQMKSYKKAALKSKKDISASKVQPKHAGHHHGPSPSNPSPAPATQRPKKKVPGSTLAAIRAAKVILNEKK